MNSHYKRYFYIIFLSLLGASILYISWIIWILSFILSIIVYSLIAYTIYILWKTIRKKETNQYVDFLEYFLYKLSWGLALSIIILGSFSYYKNEISPTPMPIYSLTNGEKNITFQAMSHIWTKDFYTGVQQRLIQKKKQWYVYFFEGVKPWTQKNMKDFNTAIWIQFDKDLYKNFSKLYWVTHQDNNLFLNQVNNKDFNIDLSIDDIMKYYKRLPQEPKSTLQNQEVLDVNSQIIKQLASLNDTELSILRYINKALLNLIIGSDTTQNLVKDNFWNKKLFSIILDKRNENIAQEIINSPHKKIFITYGLLHFKWVLKLLQKKDPNWRIVSTQYSYPIH